MINSGYALVNEADEYKSFKKDCQDNATYKKAAAICRKYHYQIADLCYVDDGVVQFAVIADRKKMQPEIYFHAQRNGKQEFKIQTTAYGSMNLIEHSKFIKAVTDAHKMVSELSKLDLTTLETTEMEG